LDPRHEAIHAGAAEAFADTDGLGAVEALAAMREDEKDNDDGHGEEDAGKPARTPEGLQAASDGGGEDGAECGRLRAGTV
jgi:hypothetical protein